MRQTWWKPFQCSARTIKQSIWITTTMMIRQWFRYTRHNWGNCGWLRFRIRDISTCTSALCESYTKSVSHSGSIKAALTGSVSGNSGGSYTRFHHSAFEKCSAIWNLTSRSPKAAETYVAITGKASSSPCITRWNSTFDCLNDLITV